MFKGYVVEGGKFVQDPDGRKVIGEVSYREDRYNLRRVLVVRRWVATAHNLDKREFATRRDAVDWIVSRAGEN